jgi:hypothetical protein
MLINGKWKMKEKNTQMGGKKVRAEKILPYSGESGEWTSHHSGRGKKGREYGIWIII